MHVGFYNFLNIKKTHKRIKNETKKDDWCRRPWSTELVIISDVCREIPRKWGSGQIEERRRGSGVQRDGRGVSMATRELQVDWSPEPNRERQTLVKNDLNVTRSHRLGGRGDARCFCSKKVLIKRQYFLSPPDRRHEKKAFSRSAKGLFKRDTLMPVGQAMNS